MVGELFGGTEILKGGKEQEPKSVEDFENTSGNSARASPNFFYFRLSFTFQLLGKLWSQVSSLVPPGTRIQLLLHIALSVPTARRFSSNVANSRSRAFRGSICTQEKFPTFFYEYALGGTRTHAIDL